MSTTVNRVTPTLKDNLHMLSKTPKLLLLINHKLNIVGFCLKTYMQLNILRDQKKNLKKENMEERHIHIYTSP